MEFTNKCIFNPGYTYYDEGKDDFSFLMGALGFLDVESKVTCFSTTRCVIEIYAIAMKTPEQYTDIFKNGHFPNNFSF